MRLFCWFVFGIIFYVFYYDKIMSLCNCTQANLIKKHLDIFYTFINYISDNLYNFIKLMWLDSLKGWHF